MGPLQKMDLRNIRIKYEQDATRDNYLQGTVTWIDTFSNWNQPTTPLVKGILTKMKHPHVMSAPG
jgi:hypothetical protein